MLKITFISEKYRKNDSQLSLGGRGEGTRHKLGYNKFEKQVLLNLIS